MATSDEYKREIMGDLARGDREMMPNAPQTDDYQNFDDFAQRSTREERKRLFGESLQHDRIPPAQMEPELRKAIAQIKPDERDDVAQEFFKELKKRGLSDRDLEKQLGLSSHHPKKMSADDVSKLASFAYHSHPDIFRDVVADKPWMMKFLSNPLVAAILGIAAAKWLSNRK
ncbi:hypothetical protein [Laspinema olomoucense]|uniref:Uncharacterized protein n=1 Tax=Laspinema olomoucense D3b TaxID=2953688 RepID=A0ABT2N7L1_9CYAN|nr:MULTISPECIES: hypothetical protein [unclassified Laspinema]MCT7974057.1 hypothetical protein [Laspinema sp. D3d]MCT7978466.1 hypothetical protein [Laspinema sp. D3b]MCT7991101.1 hypothetical protein [Laspinema sp. D3a]MCT7997040.1 hypothetical protein [Laspinema sp. D3c]